MEEQLKQDYEAYAKGEKAVKAEILSRLLNDEENRHHIAVSLLTFEGTKAENDFLRSNNNLPLDFIADLLKDDGSINDSFKRNLHQYLNSFIEFTQPHDIDIEVLLKSLSFDTPAEEQHARVKEFFLAHPHPLLQTTVLDKVIELLSFEKTTTLENIYGRVCTVIDQTYRNWQEKAPDFANFVNEPDDLKAALLLSFTSFKQNNAPLRDHIKTRFITARCEQKKLKDALFTEQLPDADFRLTKAVVETFNPNTEKGKEENTRQSSSSVFVAVQQNHVYVSAPEQNQCFICIFKTNADRTQSFSQCLRVDKHDTVVTLGFNEKAFAFITSKIIVELYGTPENFAAAFSHNFSGTPEAFLSTRIQEMIPNTSDTLANAFLPIMATTTSATYLALSDNAEFTPQTLHAAIARQHHVMQEQQQKRYFWLDEQLTKLKKNSDLNNILNNGLLTPEEKLIECYLSKTDFAEKKALELLILQDEKLYIKLRATLEERKIAKQEIVIFDHTPDSRIPSVCLHKAESTRHSVRDLDTRFVELEDWEQEDTLKRVLEKTQTSKKFNKTPICIVSGNRFALNQPLNKKVYRVIRNKNTKTVTECELIESFPIVSNVSPTQQQEAFLVMVNPDLENAEDLIRSFNGTQQELPHYLFHKTTLQRNSVALEDISATVISLDPASKQPFSVVFDSAPGNDAPAHLKNLFSKQLLPDVLVNQRLIKQKLEELEQTTDQESTRLRNLRQCKNAEVPEHANIQQTQYDLENLLKQLRDNTLSHQQRILNYADGFFGPETSSSEESSSSGEQESPRAKSEELKSTENSLPISARLELQNKPVWKTIIEILDFVTRINKKLHKIFQAWVDTKFWQLGSREFLTHAKEITHSPILPAPKSPRAVTTG